MKKTPLNQTHIDSGAKMVDFGGWHMPVQYSTLSAEHHAVRTKAGLFDVSHMGEVLVEGPEAEAFVQKLVTNNVAKLEIGQAQYTVMCYENAGIVDDLLVYKRGPEKFLLCINAGNIDKDWDWIQKVGKEFKNLTLDHASDRFSQIALQGPLSEKILSKITDYPLSQIKYYHFAETKIFGENVIVSRTGYTGEDGFELYASNALAVPLWKALMESGKDLGLVPAGLGARDTLRTEMKFPLYGHEITAETNPLEAGLGWVVKLDKPNDFVGKQALLKIKAAGTTRTLVGIKTLDRGIPRQGYEIYDAEGKESIGIVTSGTPAPSLGCNIAIGYVKKGLHAVGTPLKIKVRDTFCGAEVVATPFYQRQK